MTSANMASVRLEGSEQHIRKILKDLNGRATLIIRGSGKVLFVGVPTSELHWLDKVAKDIGCTKQELPSLPAHQKALCGILSVSKKYHEGNCKACAIVRSQMSPVGKRAPKTAGASKPVMIGKIEPGQNFDLNGVIASLELTHDRIFNQLEILENLITDMKGYRDASDKLVELEQEAKDRMSAARNLLNDGKF